MRNARPMQTVESTSLGEPGTSSSVYREKGPSVVIPAPDDDDMEICEDCDENIDDCVCDGYEDEDGDE